MSTVGSGFGAFGRNSRRGRPLPDNPYDKATVVSIYPEKISERNPTVSPGYWEIEGAPDGGFSLLVFSPSSWWKDLGQDQQLLEIKTNSLEMAESFVRDYCSGIFGCNMGDRMPGLFAIPGSYDQKTILAYKDALTGKTFAQLLEDARVKQKNFFSEVVVLADSMWSRTQGNPLAISKDARLAATKLNLKNKPWMGDFASLQMTNCPACGSLVNPAFPVCANCKTVINKERAKELNLQFAS